MFANFIVHTSTAVTSSLIKLSLTGALKDIQTIFLVKASINSILKMCMNKKRNFI